MIVELPDGTKITFPDDMPQDDIAAAVGKFSGGGPEPIAKIGEDGTVFRMPDGGLSFKSPGYATNDQDIIKRIMETEDPGRVSTSEFDRATIAQNPVAARGIKAVQGAPGIGQWMDEMLPAMGLESAQDAWRATSSAMDREHPVQSAALGVAGSLPFLAPAVGGGLKMLQNMTRAGKVATGATAGTVLGGTEGSISGYGSGTTPEGRRAAAKEGAKWGGSIGGLVGGGAPLVGDAIKAGLSKLRGKASSLIAETLGITKAAADIIKRHLDVGDLDGATRALERSGDDAMLGEATEGAGALLDAAAARGGEASNIVHREINQRVSDANRSFKEVADETLGPPAQGRQTALEEVQTRTAPARTEAYDKAYSTPIDYAGSAGQNIEAVLERMDPGMLQRAIADANERIKWEGTGNRQIMAKIGEDGKVQFFEKPNMQQLDALKRSLGDMAEGSKGVTGIMSPEGQFRSQQSSELRDALKAASDPYTDALKIGGETIRERNALDLGTKILNNAVDRDTVIREMRGASATQRMAASQGVRMAIDETMSQVRALASDPNVDARQIRDILQKLSSESVRTKIRTVMGGTEADRLFKEIDRLGGSVQLKAKVAENSKTARRSQIGQEITEAGRAPAALRGEPVKGVQQLVQALTGETDAAAQLRSAGISEEIARALTQTKGASAKEAMRIINAAMQGQKVTDAQAQFVGRLIAGLTAGGAYTAGTRQ